METSLLMEPVDTAVLVEPGLVPYSMVRVHMGALVNPGGWARAAGLIVRHGASPPEDMVSAVKHAMLLYTQIRKRGLEHAVGYTHFQMRMRMVTSLVMAGLVQPV